MPDSVRRQRALAPLAELLIAVTRQLDAARGVHGLCEARAIDPPLRAAAPEIRRATVPLLRQLRQRQMTRFHAQLLLATNISSHHRAVLAVCQLHDAAAQRHARAGRQPAATVGRQDVGAERAGGGALPPVFGPIRRAARNVSRREPGDVAVRRADPQPVLPPFQYVEHFAVQYLGHARRRDLRLALQWHERRGHERGGIYDLLQYQLEYVDQLFIHMKTAQRY